MSQSRTSIGDVRTVSIPVGDFDRALDFYTRVLGFEVRLDAPYGDGRRWVEVAAPGAVTSIALESPTPGRAPGTDTGIRLLSRDAETDHAALKERGADVDAEVARWPGAPPMFQLRDPDGNLLYIVEDMDAAQARTRQAGADAQAGGLKRFVVFVKSDEATESGALPDEASLAPMIAFNDELVDAGVMLEADGLHASADGARLRFSGDTVTVEQGPFSDPQTLVAGYWVIQASSLEQAIAWMKQAPMGGDADLEIRQVLEAEEFGEALTPELRASEDRQRRQMDANARRRAA